MLYVPTVQSTGREWKLIEIHGRQLTSEELWTSMAIYLQLLTHSVGLYIVLDGYLYFCALLSIEVKCHD